MKNIMKWNQLLAFAAIAVIATACGGGEQTAETTATPEPVADGVRTIEIIGVDEMKFVVAGPVEGVTTGQAYGSNLKLETITAAAGEQLRISLSSVSVLPATAMAHNFVLLTLDADVDAFARASISARDNGYLAPDMMGWVIAHTKMLGGGESDSITFTVPSEPGEYTFICSFPGHYAGGMVGKLIVS